MNSPKRRRGTPCPPSFLALITIYVFHGRDMMRRRRRSGGTGRSKSVIIVFTAAHCRYLICSCTSACRLCVIVAVLQASSGSLIIIYHGRLSRNKHCFAVFPVRVSSTPMYCGDDCGVSQQCVLLYDLCFCLCHQLYLQLNSINGSA